jgi:DNA-binding LytR/AlgR family response regulator
MIKCLIIDDEESAVNVLATYIDKVPFLELVETFNDPLVALKSIHRMDVDLVFLDIHMPNLSGLEFMKLIDTRAKVIFTTAYSEFAIQGFEQNAVDYLLKPITFERFLKSANRAYNEITPVAEPEAAGTATTGSGDYIFLKAEAKGKIIKVHFKDILYVEGLKNYVTVHTFSNEAIVVYMTFNQIEAVLPASFLRIHKSYIVSIDNIKSVDGNTIILTNKQTVPIGATYKETFMNKLQTRIHGGRH